MFVEILNAGARRRDAIAKAVPIFIRKLFTVEPDLLTITIEYKPKTDKPEAAYDVELIPSKDDRGRLVLFHIKLYGEEPIPSDLAAIAHECVHVYHYVSGDLKPAPNSKTKFRWKGTLVDTTITSYWDLPWEIDAYGREVGLMAHLSDVYPEYTPKSLRKR